MKRLYEYRSLARFGFLGSLALGVIAGGCMLVGLRVDGENIEPQLVVSAVFGVGVFLYLLLIGQRLFWAIDDEGISWRWVDCRSRRVPWEEIVRVDVVTHGRGPAFGGEVLRLERRDGTSVLVRPSKRYAGGLEPDALDLLERFAARHQFAVGWQEPAPPEPEEPAPTAVELPGQTTLFADRQ